MWANVCREMNIAMGAEVYRNQLVTHPLADDFTMYNLRHTYCTDLERIGVPINIASRLMGHSNIGITSKVYTHASTEALETARRLIDGQKCGQNLLKRSNTNDSNMTGSHEVRGSSPLCSTK